MISMRKDDDTITYFYKTVTKVEINRQKTSKKVVILQPLKKLFCIFANNYVYEI